MSFNRTDVYNTISEGLDKRVSKRNNVIEGIKGELFDTLTLGGDDFSKESCQTIKDNLQAKLDKENQKEDKNDIYCKNLERLIADVDYRMTKGESQEIKKETQSINTNRGNFDKNVLDTVVTNIIDLAKDSDKIDDILIQRLIGNEKYKDELKKQLSVKCDSMISGLNETQRKNLQSIIKGLDANKQEEPETSTDTPDANKQEEPETSTDTPDANKQEEPETSTDTPDNNRQEEPEISTEMPDSTKKKPPETNSESGDERSEQIRKILKKLEKENSDLRGKNTGLLEQLKQAKNNTEVAELKKQIKALQKEKQALVDRYEGTLPKFGKDITQLKTKLVEVNFISKKKEGGQTKLRIGPEIAIRHNILSRHRINATIKKLNDLGKELGPDKKHPDAKGVKKGINYILNKSFLLQGGAISSAYKATRNMFKIRTIPEFDAAFGKQKKIILEDLKAKMEKNTTSKEDNDTIKAVSNRLDYYQAAYKQVFIRV